MAQVGDHDATNQDILEAVNAFSNRMEGRFGGVEGRLAGVESDIKDLKANVQELNTTMVTKDYLDRKMLELRDDHVVKIRKTNEKIGALADASGKTGGISEADRRQIVGMDPYPRPL